MKNLYIQLLALFILTFQISFAQQMPIDFSDVQENFSTFGGSSFSLVTDPSDSGNDVGRIVNNGGLWEGVYLNLSRAIDLDFQKTISLSFYSNDSNNHNIILKLENGVNANVEVTQNVAASGWTQNITFNFANAVLSGGVTPVNASGTYNRITVFIDGGNTTSGTYFIDDIDDGSTEVDLNALDVEYNDLVWSDEFNVNGAVDAAKWFHQTQLPAGGSWYNGELQHYTNRLDNSYVDNSDYLNIVAKREKFTDQGVEKDFTSARLNSKFAFTYGRVDVRAKLPSGDGTWPAIWTLGKNISESGAYWETQGFGTTPWPDCGEIDIMEHGLGAVNHTSSAIHTPSSFGATVNTASQVISDVANNWHVYSMNWSPNQIAFLVDGIVFYTYNPTVKNDSTWPFYKDQYILLNVAMGGIAGPIEGTYTQSSMIIDYVRVYQNNALSTNDISSNSYRVYPNPTSSEINIQSDINISHIELYDLLGKLIIKESKLPHSINVSSLNPGLYVLNIYSGNTKTVKKVIIN